MASFTPYNFITLAFLGGALLWATHLIFTARGTAAEDPLKRIMTTSAWILILLGFFLTIGGTSGVVLFIAVFIAIMTVNRFRSSELATLTWCVSTAAERGIPLSEAIRGFADERADELGIRASRCADFLDAGVPTSEAFKLVKISLSTEATVAIGMSEQIGELGSSLRETMKSQEQANFQLQSVLGKVSYLSLLLGSTLTVVTGCMIWIVPVYKEMFEDFGLILPPPTELLIAISDSGSANSFFALLVMPLAVLFTLGLILSIFIIELQYLGWLPQDLPIVCRFRLPKDRALVMRWLALAVRRGHSFKEILLVLSKKHPSSFIRNRLRKANSGIALGLPWSDSLLSAGLIRKVDNAVLQSAEKAGNLAWALEEMADSGLRRLAYRVRAFLDVFFPTAILCVGFVVMFIVISLFMPIIQLITSLS